MTIYESLLLLFSRAKQRWRLQQKVRDDTKCRHDFNYYATSFSRESGDEKRRKSAGRYYLIATAREDAEQADSLGLLRHARDDGHISRGMISHGHDARKAQDGARRDGCLRFPLSAGHYAGPSIHII